MKPIKLVMKAFGPYKDTQEIDFTLLKTNNLFLITGSTGAGKTTIFDAICFALYGEASGEDRSQKGLRSDFAGADTLTEVALTFQINGVEYYIKRTPEQERPKKIGEGMMLQTASAELKTPTRIVGKIKDVDENIVEILGINARQFRQIIMIPQGEFRKLLTEKSGDREKILKELFNTSVYEKIKEEIKRKAKALSDENKTLNTLRYSEIEKIQRERDSHLANEINAEFKNIDTIIQFTKITIDLDKRVAEKMIEHIGAQRTQRDKLIADMQKAMDSNDSLDEFDLITTKYQTHQSKKNEIANYKTYADQGKHAMGIVPFEQIYQTTKTQRDDAQIQLKELSIKITQVHETLQTLETNYRRLDSPVERKKRDDKKAELTTIEGYRDKVAKIDEYLHSIETSDTLIRKMTKLTDEISNDIALQEKQSQQLVEQLGGAADAKSQIGQLTAKLSDLQIFNGQFAKLGGIQEDWAKTQSQINVGKSSCDSLEKTLDETTKKLKEVKLNYHKNQAYLLAKDLQVGDECPVCGSTEHVRLATPYKDAITKEALDKIEIKKTDAEQKYNEAKNNFSLLSQKHSNLCDNIDDITHQLKDKIAGGFMMLSSDKKTEYIDTEISKYLVGIEKIQNEINEKTNLANSTPSIKIQIEENKEHIKAENERLLKGDKLLGEEKLKSARLNTRLKGIYTDIPENLRSTELLASAVKNLNEAIKKNNEQFELAQKNYNEKNSQLSAMQGTLDAQDTEQKQKESRLAKTRHELNAKIKASIFNDTGEYNTAKEHIENIEKYASLVKQYDEQSTILGTKLKGLESKTKDIERIDIEKIQDIIDDEETKIKELNKHHGQILGSISNNINHINEIEKLSNAIEKINTEHSVVGELAKVTDGNNPMRISLERYVLAAYLDDIITAANNRLINMLNGKFLLRRATQITDMRKQSGLELEVMDNDTGKLRRVNSLSGGESFLASLSMALGLSDVVQSYAGGVQLDTMFIDEGFGTLDSETLDDAINTLIDLKSSGRLIGIISHVAELKERIDVRLEVKGGSTGSSAKFVV